MGTYTTTGSDETLTGTTGDDLYVFNVNNFGTDVIVDLGGVDTIDFSALSAKVTINLTASAGNEAQKNAGASVNWTLDIIENIIGSSSTDLIYGSSVANIITGGAGNDTMDGGSGDDTYVFTSGFGSDSLIDGAGSDTVNLSGFATSVTVNLTTGAGNEITTSASDLVNWATDFIENAIGGSAADSITGNSSANALTGGSGNDSLSGEAGNDTLDGGAGDDIYLFTAGFGSDTISGDSAGRDTIDFSAFATSVTINLGTGGTGNEVTDGTNTVNWAGSLIENATGGSAADMIYGNSNANFLIGGSGNDTLDGGVESDTYSFAGTWGADSILDSGGVQDHVTFSGHTNALTINLDTSGVGNEVTDGTNTINWGNTVYIEKATGGSGNDWLIGNNGNNYLEGGTGNDTLEGKNGSDTYVFSNSWGIDTLADSAGNNDAISLRNVTTALTINLGTLGTGDEVTDGTNTINWNSNVIEQAYAGSGNDLIYGNSAKNLIYGNTGNDTMDGGSGSDTYTFDNNWGADSIVDSSGVMDSINLSSVTTAMTINLVSDAGGNEVTNGTDTINWDNSAIEKALSGSGSDLIYGNASNNFLQGGNGNDSLYGGSGSDIYVYTANSGADVISDASGALDKVSLRAYTLSQATFTAMDSGDGDSNVDYLHIAFAGGGTLDIYDYFNNTSTSGQTVGTEGTGLIESLVFSDDTDVGFAQVQGLL